MYDYGWRQYIPELGRWNGMDQLAESYQSFSPYAYVKNNPVSLMDPDGRLTQDFLDMINNSDNGTVWTNRGGDFYNNRGGAMTGSGRPISSIRTVTKNDGGGIWDSVKSFFSSLFGKKEEGAGITTYLPGAAVTRVGVQVGPLIPEGAVPFLSFDTLLAGITRAGLWSLPLILTGDTPEREQMITLYRGV